MKPARRCLHADTSHKDNTAIGEAHHTPKKKLSALSVRMQLEIDFHLQMAKFSPEKALNLAKILILVPTRNSSLVAMPCR